MSPSPQDEQQPAPVPPTRFNYDLQATQPPEPVEAKAPEPVAAPETRFNYNVAPAASDTANRFNYDITPAAAPQPEGSWLTSSVFGKGSTDWLKNHLVSAISPMVPKDAAGNPGYWGTFAQDMAKAPAGVWDFASSPAGVALIGAHMFPVTAPFAAAADAYMGIRSGVSSLGSIANFVQDPHDPHKLAQMVTDIATTAMMAKAGVKYKTALESVPADVRAGVPLLKATYDALKTPPPPLPEARFAQGKELLAKLQDAGPEGQQAIIEQAAEPSSVMERARMNLWQAPETIQNRVGAGVASLARSGASMLGVKAPPLYDLGEYLLTERQKIIGQQAIEAARFARDLQDTVPDATERGIRTMGYVMEKSASPQDVGMTAAGEEGTRKARAFQQDTDKMLDEGYNGQVALHDADTYLSHMWDFRGVDQPTRMGVAKAQMRDPYFQARTIPDYKTGIEENGLTPLYDDVASVVAKRRMVAAVTLANQKFANTLRDLGLLKDPMDAQREGLDWGKVEDAPALNRAVYAGKAKTGDSIFRYDAPVVNPDIRMAVDAIFQKPFNSVPLAAVEQIRAFGKQANVDFSLFHHMSVGEVAQGQLATRGIKGLIGGMFTGGSELWKGTVAGIQEARGKTSSYSPPVVSWPKEMVDPWAGRLYFQTAEREWDITERMRRPPAANEGVYAKALNPPLRAFGNASYVNNRALFDFYQQGLMLKSANRIYMDWLDKNPNATEGQINNFLDVAADHVNRTFGAQNLETLMLSPNTRRFMGILMFAPVWTLSNVRSLTAGYETASGAKLTNRYWAGALGSLFLTTQMANYALTGWFGMKDKDGNQGPHFTWDNAGAPLKVGDTYVPRLTENLFNIGFGYNADGTERYFRYGKPFREVPGWFMDPGGTAMGKIGAIPGLAAVAFTGSAPGGYKLWDRNSSPEQKEWRTVAKALDFATPFSAQWLTQAAERKLKPTIFPEPTVTSQFGGVPTRQGLSFGQAVQDYREAVESGREDIKAKVLQAAQWNKLNAGEVARSYWRTVRSGRRTEAGPPVSYTSTGGLRTPPPPPPPQR